MESYRTETFAFRLTEKTVVEGWQVAEGQADFAAATSRVRYARVVAAMHIMRLGVR